MKVSDIISRVRVVINDLDGIRWLDAELIKWINDAQKMVAMLRPDASVATEVKQLSAGTRQEIPDGGFRILDVMRNMTGTPPNYAGGRSVRLADREVFDSQNFNWHKDTASDTIVNWIYDNRNPKIFYVYPPATSNAKLEVIYSKTPTELTYDGTNATTISNSLAQDLSISDIYLDAVVNYVLYRAYSKDAEYASNQQLAATYLTILNTMLGVKTQKDVAYSPDLNSKGSSPNPVALQAGGV